MIPKSATGIMTGLLEVGLSEVINESNRECKLRDYTFLESRGWRIIVVWECELTKAKLGITAAQIQKQLNINLESGMKEKADRMERREEWQMEMRRRKETQLKLLSEIK